MSESKNDEGFNSKSVTIGDRTISLPTDSSKKGEELEAEIAAALESRDYAKVATLARQRSDLSEETAKVASSTAVSKFTDSQINSFRQVFNVFDENGDGSISSDEISKLMGRLGQQASPESLSGIISAVDADGNGAIDFNEFLLVMGRWREQQKNKEPLKKVFQDFDTDNDGFITADDLARMLRAIGQSSLTLAEVDKMFNQVDKEGKGRINYASFCEIMNE